MSVIDIVDKASIVKELSNAMLMMTAGASRVAIEVEDENNALVRVAYILTDEANALQKLAAELHRGGN